MRQPRPDPRLGVRPGQPLAVAAEQLNWVNREMRSGDPAFGAGEAWATPAPYVWLPVKNTTEGLCPRGGALRISGMAHAPNEQYHDLPVLDGAVTGKGMAVALEPIKAGQIGRMAVSGVVQAAVDVLSADHRYVGTTPDVAYGLRTGWAGHARLLWAEGVGTAQKALVLIAGQWPTHRLCKTSSSFAKGTTATLDVWEDGTPPSETQTTGVTIPDVVNKYANIGSGKFVSVALHGNGRWYVVSAEC
jgi:predicted RecA/RadA family phage recombinase